MNASLYYEMDQEKRPILEDPAVKILQADGTPLSLLGATWLEVKVGMTSRFVRTIFANIKCQGILGMDFLISTQGVLDFGRLTLTINEEEIVCVKNGGHSFIARVEVAECRPVPAGHEAIIPGRIAKRCEIIAGPALVEPVQGGGELASKGLILGRTLVNADTEVIPIRVMNPGETDSVLPEGMIVGMIMSAEVEDIPSETRMVNQELPPHLLDLYERSTVNIHTQYHDQVKQCLIDFADVFSKSSSDIGCTDAVKHTIKTGDAKPVKQRLRRHPLCNQEEIERQVKDLEERGVIEPSESPWAANVVLVKKKDGTRRLCIDYRDLNEVTVKDAYPVPRIDETLDALGSAKWFSTLDLSSGYWQVALDEDAKDKSSFVVRNGLYRWKVMPFGLTNAPATFERLMEKVMKGLQWEILLIYLDDVIVYGRSVEEEIQRLRTTFSRLRAANLKLKPSKCHLFCKSVLYLGHVVTSQGISTDPDKVRVIVDWPRPNCKKEVRSFLGLASYYRRFVQDFAEIASPLHALTAKSAKFQWNEKAEQAFHELKKRLQSSPILTFPVPQDNFILDTDASANAIGAVLSQVHDGNEQVIAYFSRKLSNAERNYCVTRQELLALVHSLKHFKQYLYGRSFTVRTDHASLRWLLNFKNPEGQIARWIEQLAEYQINIEHRPGRKHTNADGLSRMQCKQCGRKEDESDTDFLNTPSVNLNKDDIDGCIRGITSRPSLSMSDIREAQLTDEDLRWMLDRKESNGLRPEWGSIARKSSAVKTYWAQWNQIEIQEGVLYRRWESDDGMLVKRQVLLPEKLRKDIVAEIHGNPLGGHLGSRKTLARVKARFYWSGLTADVRAFVRMCSLCQRRESPPRKRRAPLQQSRVGAPMERVAIDLMGPLPKTDSGNQWILVVGEYHTKWMEAYALPDAKAVTVAKRLVDDFICRFGIPLELHSDQGSNFESQVFSEVCTLLKIHKTRTTPYNPKSDGLVERFNKTVMSIVAKLLHETDGQKNWDEHLAFATSAYRATPQESTGESPNMMMLGRETRMPIDLTTASLDDEDHAVDDYVKQLRSKIRDAHERAEKCLGKSAVRQKIAYDRKSRDHQLQVGDFVWLHNPAKKKGTSPKLQLRWTGPYLILSKLSDVTLRIQSSPRAKPKVVHADRLKPCKGATPQKWEWEKPSDPHVDRETEIVTENHVDEVHDEPQHDLLKELEGGDQQAHGNNKIEEAQSYEQVSQESSTSMSERNTSGIKPPVSKHGVEPTNVRNTRYPVRNRTRPKYFIEER